MKHKCHICRLLNGVRLKRKSRQIKLLDYYKAREETVAVIIRTKVASGSNITPTDNAFCDSNLTRHRGFVVNNFNNNDFRARTARTTSVLLYDTVVHVYFVELTIRCSSSNVMCNWMTAKVFGDMCRVVTGWTSGILNAEHRKTFYHREYIIAY